VVPGEKDYIKRVIGVGGDHVSCKGNGAPILVNGKPIVEKSYLYADPDGTQNVPSQEAFDTVVPKGRLWVMGDHRALSADSRAHLGDPGGGSIPESKVVGRAFVVVWPVDRWKTLPIPATFNQPGLSAGLLQSTPLALGFVGAVPVALGYRRLRIRRLRRAS
jgi:signal peptidase I